MRILIKKCFLVALLFAAQISYADYITSADLYYECLGNNNYKVHLNVYTECGGGLDLATQGNFTLRYKSNSLNREGSFDVLKVANTGQEVNIFCASTQTNCQGGLGERGIRSFKYVGEVNLSSVNQAPDVVIYWQRDFRTSQLTSHIQAQNEPYYVEATVNMQLAPCNSSPVFNSQAIITGCVNEDNVQNLAVSDINGHTLSYSFIAPRAAADVDLIFASGFSPQRPIALQNPLAINANNQLIFRPTQINQRGLTDILVTETLNGQVIGTSTRAIQINTYDCNNQRPIISGFNGTDEFERTFCVGDTIESGMLYIEGRDPDPGQRLFFSLQSGNQDVFKTGALDTFVVANFEWIIGANDVGTHEFVVSLTDDGCPTTQTETAVFTINVTQNPTLDLGESRYIPCEPATVLDPGVENGMAPYDYRWYTWVGSGQEANSNIGEEPTFTTSSPGRYGVFITDANGCRAKDTISLYFSVDAGYSIGTLCFDSPTRLTDTTIVFLGSVEKVTWEISENPLVVLEGSEVFHTFTQIGQYQVKQIVETSEGCRVEVNKTLEVCDVPQVNFDIVDSCANSIQFRDLTIYPGIDCGVISYKSGDDIEDRAYVMYVKPKGSSDANWEILPIDTVSMATRTISTAQLVPGEYDFRLRVRNTAGCRPFADKSFTVYDYPRVRIMDEFETVNIASFSLRCQKPDTVFKAVVTESVNGPVTYLWSHNSSTNEIVTVNSVGAYLVQVIDPLGCRSTSSVSISFPIEAKFAYQPVCDEGQAMVFVDSTKIFGSAIKEYAWDFGDGNTSSDVEPEHLYDNWGNYNVTLKVTDIYECERSYSLTVYNTTVADSFRIDPDFRVQAICARNTITGYGFYPDPIHGSNIDTTFWDIGRGQGWQGYAPEQGRKITFFYTDMNDYVVKTRVRYNSHPDVHDQYCELQREGEIKVFSEFRGDIIPFRSCVLDTAVFRFTRTTGELNLAVANIEWAVAPANSINITTNGPHNPIFSQGTIFTSDEMEAKHYFDTPRSVSIYLKITDELGCVYIDVKPADIGETARPFVELDTVCANEFSTVLIGTTNRTTSGAIAIADEYFLESQGVVIDSGIATRNPVNNAVAVIEHVFGEGGDIPIKAYLQKNIQFRPPGSINTYITQCRSTIDTTVRVYDLPEVDFEASIVCAADEVTQFTNLTTLGVGQITGYFWDFGDGTTSEEKDPSHRYEKGGNYEVTLTVTTNLCENFAQKTVYVKDKPTAGYTINTEFVEAYVDIPFLDDSYSTSEIVYYFWDFKDGTTSEERNPTHRYDEITIYNVDHIVENAEGCRDTINVRTDLGVYLDLPNIFSPNRDNNNDELFLIHKSIYELYEYKIYNRWGQLIFDGGNDLNAIWNGTFKDKDQEVGVYVAYVKARGAYNTEFNFKKNIRLVR